MQHQPYHALAFLRTTGGVKDSTALPTPDTRLFFLRRLGWRPASILNCFMPRLASSLLSFALNITKNCAREVIAVGFTASRSGLLTSIFSAIRAGAADRKPTAKTRS